MHFKKTLKKERQVKTMAKKKIGIIGGGISGAGLAYHLSLYEGEADVTVKGHNRWSFYSKISRNSMSF